MGNEMRLICEDRLKKVLIRDKNENPKHIMNVLKCDMLQVLNNYMDIKSENLDIEIVVLENGAYKLLMEGYSNRIKIAKHI